jgi:ubiquinone/menaquinone biosynthesis C-methylase UbiE
MRLPATRCESALPSDLARRAGQRFARLATNLAVRRPRLWPLLRPLMKVQFDWLAPHWDRLREPGYLDAFERGLAEVEAARRVLDVGTGTGLAAFALAARFPGAEIVGVDLAAEMVEEARRKTPAELAGRVRFDVADASRLPFPDDSFDLVTLNNMIPFFDELARVLVPDGTVLAAFSWGSETPIYVPLERLRSELAARGFAEFAEFAAGSGTALLARRVDGD